MWCLIEQTVDKQRAGQIRNEVARPKAASRYPTARLLQGSPQIWTLSWSTIWIDVQYKLPYCSHAVSASTCLCSDSWIFKLFLSLLPGNVYKYSWLPGWNPDISIQTEAGGWLPSLVMYLQSVSVRVLGVTRTATTCAEYQAWSSMPRVFQMCVSMCETWPLEFDSRN